MKVRIQRTTRWLGNGFGSETLHRAYRGDELIGEWSTKMPVPWAGHVRGTQVMRFADWRRIVEEAA